MGFTAIAPSTFLFSRTSICQRLSGVPKKYRCLINNKTTVFCLIFRISFILDKAYLYLDLEMKIVKICYKLSEIYYFEVEHIEFYKPNFGDF